METDDETTLTIEGLTTLVERLASDLYFKIQSAGNLADLCSEGDGSGVHGLQMCYDRLTEAHMWAKLALIELRPSEKYQAL